jgi:hypothetical protein
MTPWLPVLKTVLPLLTSVVTATIPAFTAKRDNDRFTELQDAVTHNAASVKVLAEQMQRTVQAIEAGALAAERAVKQSRRLSVLALVVAALALFVGIAALRG